MITIDQKYADSIAQISILNDKFNRFINGKDDDFILNDKGQVIKSIAGIQKDLKSFKYVQKVMDFQTYSDVIVSDSLIETEMLCRVWGDIDNGLNGIYRKKSTASYVKISYSDIYDLGNLLPNPWNYINISKTPIEYNRDIKLFTTKLPNMVGKSFTRIIEGDLQALTDVQNYRSSYSTKFKIHLVVADNIAKFLVVLYNSTTIGLDDNTTLDIALNQQLAIDENTIMVLDNSSIQYDIPHISVAVSSSATAEEFTVSISSFKSTIYSIPGELHMTIRSIDSDKIKIFNNPIVSNSILPMFPVLI